MVSDCSEYRLRVPRALLGDLSREEQADLDQHLAACAACSSERERYTGLFGMLQSVNDEPVPRHFFVYPKERSSNPWQLFFQMRPLWQTATAVCAGFLVLIGIASASRLQVQSDHGSWTVSFGSRPFSATQDAAALKSDILQAAEEQNRKADLAWVRDLRAEIAASRTDLTQQQQALLVAALTNVESRLTNRITVTTDNVTANTRKSIVDLYQAVSLQRQEDLGTVNARVDSLADASDAKARQTDAVLDTLLQFANLSLRQPGEQK